jgi:hypothetical protein
MEPTQTLAHSKRKFNYQSLKLMTKKEVTDTNRTFVQRYPRRCLDV